jgi:peptidoglycan-associated lipoprotein
MRNLSRLSRSILALGAAAVLGACSSTPLQSPAATAPAAEPATAARPTAPAAAAPAPQSRALAAHLDPAHALYRERSVYFDFDQVVLEQDDLPLIESHGRYLAQHPTLRIAVQGHTDERGSSEYNLALGQRRAQAVKTALQVYGVRDAQIEAVSFGEEKPAATTHDETGWAKNRRAVIVY